jgi:hypothetical protein
MRAGDGMRVVAARFCSGCCGFWSRDVGVFLWAYVGFGFGYLGGFRYR